LATSVVKLPAVRLQAAATRARWLHRGLTVATFAAIYLALADVLHFDLIFSHTTASGGDMGSHHYVATFLRTDLLPHGRVAGWAPGWYAGIPMLTFYFPLPYVLIAALSPLLGAQVAFKLVSASGLLLLPLTSWGAFKVLRLPEPAPLLAAVATLPFLFMTSYTIYGGNIASTMAGEFPFSLSFALLPLALAVLWRVVEDGRWWKRAVLLVAAVVLSHILTTILLCLGVLILLVHRRLGAVVRSAARLALVFGLAFLLVSFWGLPFIFRVEYTAHFRWTQLTDLWLLGPPEIRPFLVFTAIGLVLAVRRGERRVLLLAWPVAAATFAFALLARLWAEAPLWNARMLPFIYLFSMLVAAWGAAQVVAWLTPWVQRVSAQPARVAYIGVVSVLVLSTVYGSWAHRGFTPFWARYNYEGFEVKEGWPEAKALFATLDKLPEGRVMWEFSRDYERFGTTRTLENIPVFTKQPTMEGLLIESSLNAPFHFINQAETSETSTQAVPGVDYPPFDFDTGLVHLRMFGVRYLVAWSDQVKKAAKAADLPIVATSGQFEIHELPGSGSLVEVPANRPVLDPVRDWRDAALAWYGDPDKLDVPLVFADDAQARRAFPDQVGRRGELPRKALAKPGPVANAHMVGNQELRFHTDQVGVPHVVKVSWFPNWRAEGAEGPWMLSPGLMVVVPTQPDVRLVYRDTPVETAGAAMAWMAVIVLVGAAGVDLYRRLRPPSR
jgi:6-pyruvoyl-tetrahydropterin synthase related domain